MSEIKITLTETYLMLRIHNKRVRSILNTEYMVHSIPVLKMADLVSPDPVTIAEVESTKSVQYTKNSVFCWGFNPNRKTCLKL